MQHLAKLSFYRFVEAAQTTDTAPMVSCIVGAWGHILYYYITAMQDGPSPARSTSNSPVPFITSPHAATRARKYFATTRAARRSWSGWSQALL